MLYFNNYVHTRLTKFGRKTNYLQHAVESSAFSQQYGGQVTALPATDQTPHASVRLLHRSGAIFQKPSIILPPSAHYELLEIQRAALSEAALVPQAPQEQGDHAHAD